VLQLISRRCIPDIVLQVWMWMEEVGRLVQACASARVDYEYKMKSTVKAAFAI
jgi:hypothetical protein